MKKLTKDIYWVGATDWIARHFHGYELSTYHKDWNFQVVKTGDIEEFAKMMGAEVSL